VEPQRPRSQSLEPAVRSLITQRDIAQRDVRGILDVGAHVKAAVPRIVSERASCLRERVPGWGDIGSGNILEVPPRSKVLAGNGIVVGSRSPAFVPQVAG